MGKKYENGLVYGVGHMDLPGQSNTPAYWAWHGMIKRCYCEWRVAIRPTYRECSVCDDWLYFSKFKPWYDENYRDGFCLDKDIIGRYSKVYSPETCAYVPSRINALVLRRDGARGKYPIGVTYSKDKKKFEAQMRQMERIVSLGLYKTPEDAFFAYKKAKEAYVKKVAQEYYVRGEITKRVYDALMRYEVEMTD